MAEGNRFEYSQLPDGRILWERGPLIKDWVVWDPGTRSWVQATRLAADALLEARPLSADEVRRLTAGSAESP